MTLSLILSIIFSLNRLQEISFRNCPLKFRIIGQILFSHGLILISIPVSESIQALKRKKTAKRYIFEQGCQKHCSEKREYASRQGKSINFGLRQLTRESHLIYRNQFQQKRVVFFLLKCNLQVPIFIECLCYFLKNDSICQKYGLKLFSPEQRELCHLDSHQNSVKVCLLEEEFESLMCGRNLMVSSPTSTGKSKQLVYGSRNGEKQRSRQNQYTQISDSSGICLKIAIPCHLSNIIIFYCHSPIKKMQNLSNMTFFYLPVTFPFLSYTQITSPSSEHSTPLTDLSQIPQASYVFPSHLDQFYCNPDSAGFVTEHNRPDNDVAQQPLQIHPPKVEFGSGEELLKGFEAMPTILSLKDEANSNPKIEEDCLNYIRKKQNDLDEAKKKKQRRRKRVIPDQDYLPETQRVKKQASKYQINDNRNVIPNEINQIFSFVQKQTKSGQLVDKLFRKYKHPEQYSVKRFYLYQALLKNRLGHYSNQRSLKVVNELYEPKCENWSEKEQRFYNKICRVLIHHFLHEDSIFIILTSRRMKREKKSDHLRARRQIALSVGDILRGL